MLISILNVKKWFLALLTRQFHPLTNSINAGLNTPGEINHHLPFQKQTITLKIPVFTQPQIASLLWLMVCLLFSLDVPAQVSGTVFKDFNADGTYTALPASGTYTYGEPGMEGVVVKATNPAGTALAVTYTGSGTATNGTGSYAITGGTLGQIRLEFVMPDDYTFASNGSSGGTTVMFPSAATQNLAANYPADYCQDNPQLVVPCYVGRDLTGPFATEAAMARFNYYGSTGEIGSSGYPSPTKVTDHQHLGGTYGVAYSRLTKKVFTGAVLHRHVAYGPLGIGGIYEIDPNTGTVNDWLNIETLAGIDAGTDTRDATTLNSISAIKNYDYASFALVGKTSLGDVEISDDGKVLYVINVFQQSLVAIDATTKALVGSYSIPVPAGLTCPLSDFRPWGLKYYKGKLYVGAVCTAQTSQLATDLKAYVLQFDPANPGAGFSTYFSFPLNYSREQDNWHPWNQNSYEPGSNNGPSTNQRNSQPILSNIEFDVDGSLIMGFLDRHVMMFSSGNFPPDPTAKSTVTVTPFPNGDLLRACMTSAGLVLEGGAGCSFNVPASGNSAIEFYDDRRQGGTGNGNIREVAGGSLALLPGSTEIAGTGIDELATNENGIGWWSNTTGRRNRAYMLTDDTPGSQGKTSGLGDLELLCNPAPIEIGNRVWNDTDSDGIQDAGETGISDVSVTLCTGTGTAISTAVTDANGNYYFSSGTGTSTASAIYGLTGLTANTAYQVKFPTTNAGKSLVSANATTDNLDSDPSASGVVSFSTVSFGQNNHTFDAGYGAVSVCSLTATATPTACNPAANQYSVSGNISLTGTSGGVATITDGAKSTTVTVAASATSVAYSLAGLISGTGSHTVTVSLPGCGTAVVPYTGPASCTSSQTCPNPLITDDAGFEVGTSNVTSTVGGSDATLSVYGTDGPTDWKSDGGTAYWVNAASQGGSGSVQGNYLIWYNTPAGPNNNKCTAWQGGVTSFKANSCYKLCYMVAAFNPANLTEGSKALIEINKSSASVAWAITPSAGGIIDNADPGVAAVYWNLPAPTSPKTITGAVYTGASGQVLDWKTLNWVSVCVNATPSVNENNITINFSVKGDPTTGITGGLAMDAISICEGCDVAVCSLTATSTPTACNSATNQYSVSGTISLTGTSGGVATITDGTKSTTVTVAASATSVAYSLTGLTSNAASHTVTVTLAGCSTATATYNAPASCSVAQAVCSFSATASATCNNNGSLTNAADDFLSILLTPTGPFGKGFTLTATQAGSPISLSLSSGNSFTSLTYGYPTPLKAPTGTPGKGNIILTLTDLTNATCTQQVTVTDPGACTAGACVGITPQTVTYSYRTPFLTTDLDNEPINLPQFNDPARTLTKVDLSYGILEGTNLLAENTAATATSFRPTITSDVLINLGAATLLSPSLSYTPGFIAMPAGITVTAQGSYGGDLTYNNSTNVSTLEGMKSWLNAYMQDIFVDPRTDPRWVTTATGSATTDDDIYVMPVQSLTAAGVSSFSSAADLAQFLGTGQVPAFTVSTFNGFGITGGGGNIIAPQNTKAYGYATVTYTYTCNAAVCSLTATATPTACNSATNQYSVSGTISLTNNSAGGTATITDGAKSTTVTVAASATSVAYSLTGLTSNAASHTVTVTLAGCGTAVITYTAPASCSIAPAALAVVVSTPVCNSATNNFTATGTVSLTNATAGSLTITDNGSTIGVVSVTAGQTTASFSVSGVSGNSPAAHTVVAALGTTTASTTYATPASCTVCSLSLTTASLPAGQVGTAYSQTLTATGVTAPLTYSVLGGSLPAGLTMTSTGVISGTPTSAATTSFTVKVTDSKSCSDAQPLTITIASLPVCSLATTATPGVCSTATNTYVVTGTVSSTNAAINNASPQTLTISVGSATTTATLTGNGPVSYTLTGLNSDGLTKTVTVVSSATACGLASVTYTAPASCTIAPAALAVVVSTPVCNSATNNYTATGSVSLTNATAGSLTLTDNGSTIGVVSVTAGQTSASFPVSGVSNATTHTVVATLTGGTSASGTYTAPVACTIGTPTINLEKFVSKSVAKVGDVLTYTIVLTNAGTSPANNVTVRDSSTTGLRFVPGSASAPAGTTFIQGNPLSTWTIASLSAAQSLSLTFQAIADSAGILYNTAIIPGDTARVCTSIPYRVCKGSAYQFQLGAAAGSQSYQWYQDNVAITGATSNTLLVSAAGSYSVSINGSAGCLTGSCCPFIIEEIEGVSSFSLAATTPTCNGTVAQSNGQLTVTGLVISTATTYTYKLVLGSSFAGGTLLTASKLTLPSTGILNSSLPPGTYTVRIYNESGCYGDVTAIISPANCGCPVPKCVPFVIQAIKRAK